MKPPKLGFYRQRVSLPLDKILPLRSMGSTDKLSNRYRAIAASIREVGVIEPLMVYPQKEGDDLYLLLDGHLRLHALRQADSSEAECLVATDDERFTYNARINRLPPIEEHKMIAKAVKNGVSIERIAAALDLKVKDIRERINLLRGISPEAAELLKGRPIKVAAIHIMRKVKPMRQIEIADLMISANNYTRSYAEALLLGTSKDMLVDPEGSKTTAKISPEDIARMEMEMETLERDYKAIEEGYADNMLNLTVLRGYLRKLLVNSKIMRFLGTRHGELVPELERIAATEEV